jgi:hypothetical protein
VVLASPRTLSSLRQPRINQPLELGFLRERRNRCRPGSLFYGATDRSDADNLTVRGRADVSHQGEMARRTVNSRRRHGWREYKRRRAVRHADTRGERQ